MWRIEVYGVYAVESYCVLRTPVVVVLRLRGMVRVPSKIDPYISRRQTYNSLILKVYELSVAVSVGTTNSSEFIVDSTYILIL